MHAVLSQHSGNAQIRLIKDGAATHAGILQAFEDHLLNNASIKRDDAIVVYFAGKGRRLPIPQGASGRDVDVLVPYDYGETVLGIADSTIHSLLSDLAQNKGANIVRYISAWQAFGIFSSFQTDLYYGRIVLILCSSKKRRVSIRHVFDTAIACLRRAARLA
jgi:hypothetical protein